MNNLPTILATAHAIALEAGQLLHDGYYQTKIIDRKSSAVDLVTQYDTAAEILITQRLQTLFPDHTLLGEEGTNNHNGSSPYSWHIDPLDGTTNFAHRFPVFAVSMALYQGDEPLVGVVFDPMRDECFLAAKGHGATLETQGMQLPLQVSETASLRDSLLGTGFPYDRHTSEHNNIAQNTAFMKQAQGIRRAGAAALDMAYVAAGRLDGYWEYKLHSWDVAAGILLVQEAGGQVTDICGKPPTISQQMSLIVSNGVIHPAMQAMLAPFPLPFE